jgi:hypothetical protein
MEASMSAYHMTCSCGHDIKVDAKDRADAVSKIQGIMTKDAIAAHMKERHPGEPIPPVSAIHQMIAENTAAA